MYKFEISADSPQELQEMQLQFARNLLNELNGATIPNMPSDDRPQYADQPIIQTPQVPPFVPPAPQLSPASVMGLPTPVAPSLSLVNAQPAVAGDQEVDSKGLPWDVRIHSSAKSKIKAGTWKYKKGLTDEAYIAKIEAELHPLAQARSATAVHDGNGSTGSDVRQGQAPVFVPVQNVSIASVPPIPSAPAPTTPVEIPQFNAVGTPTQPAPVVQAVQQYENLPIPQGQVPAHSLKTFRDNFPMILAELITSGKITPEYLGQLKAYYKVENIWVIAGNEHQSKEMYDAFANAGFISAVG